MAIADSPSKLTFTTYSPHTSQSRTTWFWCLVFQEAGRLMDGPLTLWQHHSNTHLQKKVKITTQASSQSSLERLEEIGWPTPTGTLSDRPKSELHTFRRRLYRNRNFSIPIFPFPTFPGIPIPIFPIQSCEDVRKPSNSQNCVAERVLLCSI